MRVSLTSARAGRLYFAQVREDPRLEIEALIRDGRANRTVVVGSGGCTALSLLAAGASDVLCVDVNPAQNHLVELKLSAVSSLGPDNAISFLGSGPASPGERHRTYTQLRPLLSDGARAYWDARPASIEGGANVSGVTERFLSAFAFVLRHVVLGAARVERMLSCASIDEQRRVFDLEWQGWRWHALFAAACSRLMLHRTYDPRFFASASRGSVPDHFRQLAERTLLELPVADNYFVHQMLGGAYRPRVPGAVPPYLSEAGARAIAAARNRITFVDGGMTDCLQQQPSRSIDAFALSNICEWLTTGEIDALFGEIARTAAPGARLVFRNFVGWTEVPERWRDVVIEDRVAGDALIKRDRSGVQRRIAVCRVQQGVAA